jgi:type II secretory pathway component PulM
VNIPIAILTLILLAVVITVISAPLRSARQSAKPEAPGRAELHAAREAKYREIRDAELDYRTGKLSNEDFQAIDRTLRAEALEILEAIKTLEPEQREPEQAAQEE